MAGWSVIVLLQFSSICGHFRGFVEMGSPYPTAAERMWRTLSHRQLRDLKLQVSLAKRQSCSTAAPEHRKSTIYD